MWSTFYPRHCEKVLYKPIFLALPRDSGRARALSELLASVRRQGVRAEGLLKDADNLTQRYKKLEVRLQEQADAQNTMEGKCDELNAQAESTRTWISDLLQPLASPGPDVQTEEMKEKAQVRTEIIWCSVCDLNNLKIKCVLWCGAKLALNKKQVFYYSM